jgi:hypothetical protein
MGRSCEYATDGGCRVNDCGDGQRQICARRYSEEHVVNGCYYSSPNDLSFEQMLELLEDVDESPIDVIVYTPLLAVLSEEIE